MEHDTSRIEHKGTAPHSRRTRLAVRAPREDQRPRREGPSRTGRQPHPAADRNAPA